MKKVEIIVPNGRLSDVHQVLTDLNVGGMSHYGIEGSGKVKVDPVVAATHPKFHPEYILRHKVEVVIKDEQVQQLMSKVREKLHGETQGGKIFVTDVPIAVDIATGRGGEEAI